MPLVYKITSLILTPIFVYLIKIFKRNINVQKNKIKSTSWHWFKTLNKVECNIFEIKWVEAAKIKTKNNIK